MPTITDIRTALRIHYLRNKQCDGCPTRGEDLFPFFLTEKEQVYMYCADCALHIRCGWADFKAESIVSISLGLYHE